MANTLTSTIESTLSLTLKGTSVAVTLNGAHVTTWSYNAPATDRSLGVFTKGGTSSFDNVHIRTNDHAFSVAGNILTGAVSTLQPAATEMIATAPTQAKAYYSAGLGASLSYIRRHRQSARQRDALPPARRCTSIAMAPATAGRPRPSLQRSAIRGRAHPRSELTRERGPSRLLSRVTFTP